MLDDTPLPDPCSRWQPDGLRGPSRIVDPLEFEWTDGDFRTPGLHDAVLYELHVGTFSPEGTFDGAIPFLAELAELGVTAIEIMPVAEFPGTRGWGYDGVYLSAAQSSYGGPLGLQRFVDAAHAHGLAVILDVVYNHVGASGSQALMAYGPYFTHKHETPWGAGLNVDDERCDAVREWVCQSAEGWARDFHLDGLRLDAIHAIVDSSPEHLVAEIARRVHTVRPGAIVIAESGLNDPRVMRVPELGGHGCDAAWADDFHHALRVLLTGDTGGWYAEFDSMALLAKAFKRPHVHDGVYSEFRRRRFGAPADDVPRGALRRLLRQPRPGRQPRAGRPPAGRDARAGGVLHAAVAVHADALPGRGIRRARAVSVLHRPHRRRDRRRHARGPPARVRLLRRVQRRAGARPAGRGHVRALEADARRASRRACASSTRTCCAPAETLPPGDVDEVVFDERAGWLAVRRGECTLLANFARATVHVPRERTEEVLLATHEPTLEPGFVVLPPLSGRWSGSSAHALCSAHGPMAGVLSPFNALWRSGLAPLFPSARRGTGRERTSRSSPSTRSGSSCACSTTRTVRRPSS